MIAQPDQSRRGTGPIRFIERFEYERLRGAILAVCTHQAENAPVAHSCPAVLLEGR